MKKLILAAAALVILFSTFPAAFAKESPDTNAVLSETAAYLYKNVSPPAVGSVGGEWAILGLSRSGIEIPDEYYSSYFKNVQKYVKDKKGVLHNKKYTEYSRVILALTAIGKNPADVAGYNLLTPLGDYEKTIWQGLNGPIWALIALDSGGYEIPKSPKAKIQATREMYINRILDCQLPDGGWSLFGGTPASEPSDNISDADITGMALQALAKYTNDKRVSKAIDKALTALSGMQDSSGGFSSGETANSESCVQVIVALCELGIPLTDPRFVKNGCTVLDNLLENYYNNKDGFLHIQNGKADLMATEQALYGLCAVKRMTEGKNSLYRMSDAISFSEDKQPSAGLAGKSPDVVKTDIVSIGRTFSDIGGTKAREKIEALAARGIINGKTENLFAPDATMTRAEFAAIITRALGLSKGSTVPFTDVSGNDWYYSYVNTAYTYGIVKGTSGTMFCPGGTISRAEAAVMTARAAKLCGAGTDISAYEARDILAEFFDYVKLPQWAFSSVAFCFREGILSRDMTEIKADEAVTRAEIAVMLYNMLNIAELL